MKKYNFIKVIAFISILILFFAQSLYDTSVHARMKQLEDESLSDIDAAALDTDIILNIRVVVNSGFSFAQPPGGATVDSINIGTIEIGDANLDAGSSFQTHGSYSWDIGSSANPQVWLLGGNLAFPVQTPGAGLGMNATNVFLYDGPTAHTLPIGNLTMKGFVYGENVTSGLPNLSPFEGGDMQRRG